MFWESLRIFAADKIARDLMLFILWQTSLKIELCLDFEVIKRTEHSMAALLQDVSVYHRCGNICVT